MSDEQTPPPPSLRLKPRLKPADGETPAAAPPATTAVAPATIPPTAPASAEAAAGADGGMKIRLKPRLAVAVASAEPVAAVATPAAAPEPAPPPAVIPAPEPAPVAVAPVEAAPAAAGPPRIKLKPRAPEGAAAATSAAPAAAPVVFAPPPPPAPEASPAAPAAVSAPAAPAAPAAEPGKFKFKPKAPPTPPPASSVAAPAAPPAGMPPPPPPPGAAPKSKPPFPPPPGVGAKSPPPPFPVVAPAAGAKGAPPVPHLHATEEPEIPEENVPAGKVPLWKKGFFKYAVIAILLLGSMAYRFVRDSLVQATSDTIREKVTQKADAPKAAAPAPQTTAPAAAPAPELANKAAQPTPGLSETQNAIAHAPVNAINKARDVVAQREDGGQGRDAVGAITDGNAPAASAEKAARPAAAPQTVAGTSSIAPGVSVTNSDVAAAAEATPAFRSFVANAKVGGVFQGTPPRLLINGRTVRGGDFVDAALGITFDSIDPEKKTIIFKDKAGAIVTRRY